MNYNSFVCRGGYCSSIYGRGTGGICGGGGGEELVPTLFIGQAKARVAEKKINF